MRVFGWAFAFALIGLVGGYAATLGIGIVLMEVNGVSQREGAAAMGLAFIIAPIGACVTAIVTASTAAVITGRRERDRLGGTLPPRQPWGRTARGAAGGLGGFVLGYGAAVLILFAFYQLRGSPYFETYVWALAAAWLPVVLGIAGAVGGAQLAMREKAAPAT
ncbi:MAG: hypothetical protein JNK84_04615 [Phreatobacter sp.]|uniref:hypothetical protein n=1 Tax=Phreatobacter sp. TaxID=1966341 RepID=UPI001A443450|nr:hypothetical protein [Phreatobacter sp.]MBL8568347.1 hypothetical protein [Phreatobacter sp.]